MTPRLRTTPALAGAALVLTLLVGAPAGAQDEDPDEKLRDLVESVATATEAEHTWNDAIEIATYREKASAFVTEALRDEEATDLGRVALARVLLELGQPGRAAAELIKVVKNRDAPVALQVEAIRLIEATHDDTLEDELFDVLDNHALDPRKRAALARCLWRLTRDIDAKKILKDLLRGDDFDIQVEGALALAEIGDLKNPEVRAVLHKIRREPTPRGRLANALMLAHEVEDALIRQAAPPPRPRTPEATTAPAAPSVPGARLATEALARPGDRARRPGARCT